MTDVPPLDLRRDELPYLRMGKALGDLSMRPQDIFKGDDTSGFEKKFSSVKQTPLLQERWEKIVQFVQKKYPLRLLKPLLLETEWTGVKNNPGLFVRTQVSLASEFSCCNVKVFFQLNPDYDIDIGHISVIKEEIGSEILTMDRVYLKKVRGEKT